MTEQPRMRLPEPCGQPTRSGEPCRHLVSAPAWRCPSHGTQQIAGQAALFAEPAPVVRRQGDPS